MHEPDVFDYEQDDKEDRLLVVDKLEAETDKAWGVKGTDGQIVWLPKSQVTMTRAHGECHFDVPGWLAAKKDTLEFSS